MGEHVLDAYAIFKEGIVEYKSAANTSRRYILSLASAE
jgi:hypothetical protein